MIDLNRTADTFHMRVIPFPTPHYEGGMGYTIVEEWKDHNGKVVSDMRRQVGPDTFLEFAKSVSQALATKVEDFT